jgi:hypothetical protein
MIYCACLLFLQFKMNIMLCSLSVTHDAYGLQGLHLLRRTGDHHNLYQKPQNAQLGVIILVMLPVMYTRRILDVRLLVMPISSVIQGTGVDSRYASADVY